MFLLLVLLSYFYKIITEAKLNDLIMISIIKDNILSYI